MEERFIPVLSHFLNGNPWTASQGRLRCRVIPTQGESEDDGTLTAEVWEGPWAHEFSTVEETKVFPLSDEGRDQLRAWLDIWQVQIDGRPHRTMAEDLTRRVEPEA